MTFTRDDMLERPDGRHAFAIMLCCPVSVETFATS